MSDSTAPKMTAFTNLALKYVGFFIGTAIGQSLFAPHGVQWGNVAAIAGITTALVFGAEKMFKPSEPAPSAKPDLAPEPQTSRKENEPRCPFL